MARGCGFPARHGVACDEDDPIVIVVTHELPYPPRAGNQYRINRYVRWLSERGNQVLTLFCPLEAPKDIETLEGAAAEPGTDRV